MAGILKVDQVQSDSNLAFAIAGSNVAFMNATSLQMVGSNVSLAGTNVITNGKVVTSAQPTGAVLQVVSANDSTQRSTASGSFVASGMLVTITPTSATSKIFVKVDTCCYKNADNSGYLSIFRNGTNLAGSGNQMNMLNVVDRYIPTSFSYLDSPASTSALTYEIYYYRTGTQNIYINSTNSGTTMGSITAMEIAG